MKEAAKVGGIAGFILAVLPLISQFIIRDTISLDVQIYILLIGLFVASAIPAGIYYYRCRDLENNIQSQKNEFDEKIQKLESKIQELENNREGLSNNLLEKNNHIALLSARLGLYAFSLPKEVLQQVEHAATIMIEGSANNGSESNKNH